MSKIHYRSIVERLWKLCGKKMTDWENGFVDNLIDWKGDYTENQKEVIIKLNRKYIATR